MRDCSKLIEVLLNDRLAVVFLVLAPLALWIWSLIAQPGREDAVKRIMFGYWQVRWRLLKWAARDLSSRTIQMTGSFLDSNSEVLQFRDRAARIFNSKSVNRMALTSLSQNRICLKTVC